MNNKKIESIEGVILDWAGTTVDFGSMAPVQAFIDAFGSCNIKVTIDEVREPMGMLKKDHIRYMLNQERVNGLWLETWNRPYTESDVEIIYSQFEVRLMGILKEFSKPKPYVLETVEWLRNKGIKIGSTTGYTDGMMEIVAHEAKEQGYEPDVLVTPDTVGGMGRPYPYMIFKNMELLKIMDTSKVLKVGDTISDIQEGNHAGVWTAGIIEGSSVMGLSMEEFAALSQDEKDDLSEMVKQQYLKAGADFVFQDIRDLLKLIEA
ncbi:MAG TPA: phosphonoacetaldehyde hydrolase [Candidatus Merdenecus merdavium]|nr:phosphonoacetaldehyde hydrolase [Candidatus Merdenecus merdavium]